MLLGVLRASGLWGYWVPHIRHILVVSDGKSGLFRSPSPARLRKQVHPPASFSPLQSPAAPYRPYASRCRAPSGGFRPSSRHQPAASMPLGSHTQLPCRPRRFSRPRRFTPPLAWWVYFTPQPRPGFALQGLPLSHSRDILSMSGALSSFSEDPLPLVAQQRHASSPRPQGFAPCASALLIRRRLSAKPARSPRELLPPSGFPAPNSRGAFTLLAARGLGGWAVKSSHSLTFSVPV